MPRPHPNYNACRSALPPAARAVFERLLAELKPEDCQAPMALLAGQGRLPAFLPDLFRVENQLLTLARQPPPALAGENGPRQPNPTLRLVPVGFRGLARLLSAPGPPPSPAPGVFILLWLEPDSGRPRVEEANDADLLALKLLADPDDCQADLAATPLAARLAEEAIQQGVAKGLILAPPPRLRRPSPAAPGPAGARFTTAPVFTLQWHLTQACDLHCRHCYDRGRRETLPLDQGLALLDDLVRFCAARRVQGQVSFTGGNPFLAPHFFALYQGAAERGLRVAVLGNPVSRPQLAGLIAIAKPLFYQVSLEGLEGHNDAIRGPGHYRRTMEFLPLLRQLEVYSLVMLTLTQANQAQVLPLAERLRGRADLFTFNRLAPVGEGAALAGADSKSYRDFLREYLRATQDNPVLGLKDNLFNLLLDEQGEGRMFGGCTGHGCGAAFDFLAVLADGEVHACRKFPSPLGNLTRQDLATIYDSATAVTYRSGSLACAGCPVQPRCGGCLAVGHGLGLDPLIARDPYCWRPA
ncbi:MAG: thio(seleno)oxazole modification radical SAM maturase SbtM [Desulfobacteraceae bacterium]|nr:thio(seleno)oxazole modification radical SAM maturase SbtM [Desulfobacteraceae bacterium]